MERSIVGLFLGNVVSSYAILYLLGIHLLPLLDVLAYAGIGAILEGSLSLDNIFVLSPS